MVTLRLIALALTLACSLLPAGEPMQCEEVPSWARQFVSTGTTGVFVLYDVSTGRLRCSSQARANQRFSPASTFKILNSLIALETGARSRVDEVVSWDGRDRHLSAWNRDQSMRFAFPNSTVWFYQDAARKTGERRMQKYLDRTHYGNARIGTSIDQFWLNGTLQISAIEQVEFLKRMWGNALPFRPATIAAIKELMVKESTGQYVLRGKTGWDGAVQLPDADWLGFVPPQERGGVPQVGWWVGTVEGERGLYAFALNVDFFRADQAKDREGIGKAILRAEGILAASGE